MQSRALALVRVEVMLSMRITLHITLCPEIDENLGIDMIINIKIR